MGWVMMSERELQRVEVLAQVDDGKLSVDAGAGILADSRRQMFRLLRRYRSDGATAIRHQSRGQPTWTRKSITFDRDTEVVSWPHLQGEIGTQLWFCDPSAPWQKGAVENTNQRDRNWLPRKRDITALSDQTPKVISAQLNNTPR